MQWSQFVLQSLYLLKRSLTKRERWILRRKWATTCGVIPRKKETKIIVWSRKGNGRLSWYDPRLLNSNSRSFLNPRPMAPLQPRWSLFDLLVILIMKVELEHVIILFIMFDSFHEIFCIQIKRSFIDIFICDNSWYFLCIIPFAYAWWVFLPRFCVKIWAISCES